ncbi:MAG: methyltransferase domain-containing protein [bacterium]|nr:methyltransferase domain-containing protein [bacterium]
MSSKKLLAFNFPNAESTQWLKKVLSCAAAEGWELFWVDFFGDQLFPLQDLADVDCHYHVFLDRSQGSAPRLSEEQYCQLMGDDIDFLRIATHEQLVAGLPVEEASMSAEGIPRQRLRGAAFRMEQLLKSLRPDFVLVPQGVHSLSRIALAKCRKFNIPVAVRESPFFPDYCLIDTQGMHFLPNESEIASRWPEFEGLPLSLEQQHFVDSFLNAWKSNGQSKYNQRQDASELELLTCDIERARRQGRRLLFFPGQLDNDASVLYGLQAFDSLRDFETCLLRDLPEDAHLVFKPHPYATHVGITNQPNISVCNQVGVHELLRLTDAVVTFSSNVGLEALLYDKPVVCAGRPHYSGKGITMDIMNRGELSACLAEAAYFVPNKTVRDRYLHYLLTDYLFHETDSRGFTRKAERALQTDGDKDQRVPFGGQASRQLRDYLETAEAYTRLSRENLTHDEILTRLAGKLPDQCAKERSIKAADLKSGERQWGLSFQDIEVGHLARYSLVEKLLPDSCKVLDIACGTGYGSFIMAAQGNRQVTAVDASQEAIGFARSHWKHAQIEYVHASCGSFFEAGTQTFDAIVCLETVEHLVNPRRFLESCWQSLSDRGMLVLSVPHANVFPLLDTEFHVQHFTEQSLRQLFDGYDPQFVSVLGQNGVRISDNKDSARFLMCVVAKQGLGDLLESVLPFELDRLPERDVFEIPASLFTSPQGVLCSGNLQLPAGMSEGIAFYGPYFNFPEGWYQVQFHFAEGRLPAARTRLDVAQCTGRILAEGHAAELDQKTLLFHHDQPDIQLEFRAIIEGAGSAHSSMFSGVTLTRCESLRQAQAAKVLPLAMHNPQTTQIMESAIK